jgi:hypothetical protein
MPLQAIEQPFSRVLFILFFSAEIFKRRSEEEVDFSASILPR